MFQLQFDPDDDVAGSFEDVLLIWDFEVNAVLSAGAIALCPHYPDENTVDGQKAICPILDIKKPTSNCSNFPNTSEVVVVSHNLQQDPTTVRLADDENEFIDEFNDILQLSPSEDEEQPVQTIPSVHEEEQYTELILMKGSSYHKHFQCALKDCKLGLIQNDPPQVRLLPEPTNKRDENAIVVQALIGIWTPIGYVPAVKVPKVTHAIRKSEITNVVLTNVIYKYVYGLGKHSYFPSICVSKLNRWLPNKKNYKYNNKI